MSSAAEGSKRRIGSGRVTVSAGDSRRCGRAFTLIEVTIAAGILFTCLFAILALLAGALRNARALQMKPLDASMAAAEITAQLTATNQVSEGPGSGDFGDVLPKFSYTYLLEELGTNGFCNIDVVVQERGRPGEVKMSFQLYLPNLRRSGAGIQQQPAPR